MGDFEDVFGSAAMSADFAPWDSPCWNDDWEQSYLDNDDYKTVSQWNKIYRYIKKGEKGKYLPCARVRLFHKSQTRPITTNKDDINMDISFESAEEAIVWAKQNVGRVITRSPDGKGYVAKKQT